MALSLSITKIEMLKVSRGLSLEIVNELFQFKEKTPYELRQGLQFKSLAFIQFLVVQKVLNFLGEDMGTGA